MDHREFKRILTTFADMPADIDLAKGKLLMQIRDEVIEATIFQREGTLYIRENDEEMRARQWLTERIARTHQLADRILTYINDEPYFVTPSGSLVDQPSIAPGLEPVVCGDVAKTTLSVLDRRPAAMSTVLYLTSDAGEGKTTLINHLARIQAASYKAKQTDWLLLPISLGGRSFLRFDDVVISSLVNRLRFQFLYYDAFVELVRLGIIIPAFDGFEEMFVESSSGEALSALGNLMKTLSSSGTVLIAARKAYFEYKSFEATARLFDSIGDDCVEFARLSLDRWTRQHFLEYARRRKIQTPEDIYEGVLNRFDAEHPLLTRAVLVRHLFDLASKMQDRAAFFETLGQVPHDYFFRFVNTIVEREANEKWIDRSGEPHKPLITPSEHLDLLSLVAEEMWNNSTDSLSAEVMDVIADLFSDSTRKASSVSRQIKERLKQHALVIGRDNGKQFSFDHEEFRDFFLGEALGGLVIGRKPWNLLTILSKGPLPIQAIKAAIARLGREGSDIKESLSFILSVTTSDSPASYSRENSGGLCAQMMAGLKGPLKLEQVFFPTDTLCNTTLTDIIFETCSFQPTSLEGSRISNCEFNSCHFERIELHNNAKITQVRLNDTDVGCVVTTSDTTVFDPVQIHAILVQNGFALPAEAAKTPTKIAARNTDDELKVAERLFRIFLRSSQTSESVIRKRIGDKASLCISQIIPALRNVGVIVDLENRGGGMDQIFKLGVPMLEITRALTRAQGSFGSFIKYFEPQKP